jgi:hypothetical protein
MMPQDFTTITTGKTALDVVEGMFDLLSHETLIKEIVPEPTHWPVLNSLSFLAKAEKAISIYQQVFLLLNSDQAGVSAAERRLTRGD